MSKLKAQQKNNMISTLIKEYELLKNIITYLTNGVKYLSSVYGTVEREDSTCKGVFFVIENHRLEGLQK
jgi:hypothetical protein